MCMIDGIDPCTWLGTTRHVAQKPHCCDECGRDIAAGEQYDRSAYVQDSVVFSNKACAHCAAARTWLSIHCGGWVTEALREELEEHWDERYREDRLGRLIVGMRNQWHRLRGDGLMPIPAVVTSRGPER